MAAGNFSIFKATDIDSFKFGDTAWSETDMASTTISLNESFDTNNASPLLDVIGAVGSDDPVKSEAWAKEVSITGNERNITEEDFLGKDPSGAQNKEVVGGSVSRLTAEVTMAYRNNVPLSIFNDLTKSAIITADNGESADTGRLNYACNNITITKVGDIKMTKDGLWEQKLMFTFGGGTTGPPITVTQVAPAESWSKVRGGDNAEEVLVA